MKIQRTQKGRQTINQSNGFTIIEVVLVLAIAGLIFLMVFIALPALQRAQRDTQRKSDLARIMTQITNYSSNNRGKVPTSLITPLPSFVTNYLGGTSSSQAGSEYVDPITGEGYLFQNAGTTAPSADGTIGYSPGYICGLDGSMTPSATAGSRQFALVVKLEGQKAPYCVDNR